MWLALHTRTPPWLATGIASNRLPVSATIYTALVGVSSGCSVTGRCQAQQCMGVAMAGRRGWRVTRCGKGGREGCCSHFITEWILSVCQ